MCMKLRRIALVFLLSSFCGFPKLFAASSNDVSKLSPGDHTAAIDEIKLHYYVAGHGPLVLVTSPGWGIGSIYLQNGLAPLEQSFTLLFIDTRGSGKSTRPADDRQMGTDAMADDIEAMRLYLGLPSIALMGHSGGGTIALEYAERHPHAADKIVLLDPGILGDPGYEATEHTLNLWREDPRYREAVRNEEEAEKKNSEPSTDEEFERYLSGVLPLYFSDPDRFVIPFIQTYADTHLSSYAERMHNAADRRMARNQAQDYSKVLARTFIMNGTVDWVCLPESAQRAHAGIRGSELSLYANAGHVLWIEQPQRFFAELTRFLQQ